MPDAVLARSVSSQFIVSGRIGSRLAATPAIATNADYVRLEPALLAVSAERLREAVERELDPGLQDWNPAVAIQGRIYLTLHPAQSPDETVTILSRHGKDGWDYQVQLPDVLHRTRYVRALTGVLLLQFANDGSSRADSAEVPAWLIDGLSEELQASGWQELVLSSPARMTGQAARRTFTFARGLDSLAGAREVLRNHPALTFAQLSWPTESQLTGADGGVYRASAQLFVNSLLQLKGGPAGLRTMLEALPKCYNWQTAFQSAFHQNFPRPLDVEKWWAVLVVSFVAHEPGLAWTPGVSRDRLDEILSVPVEMRQASNALPAHAQVSFQAVIRNFNRAQQETILRPKLRELELAQLRMAEPFAVLAEGYHRALEDYFDPGKHRPPASRWVKHPTLAYPRPSVAQTLTRLDDLDAQRRELASALARQTENH